MAGLGESCTHVASLMFAVEAIIRLRETATVTQEPAYWKLPASKKKVEYPAERNIDFSSSKMLKKKLDNTIDKHSSVDLNESVNTSAKSSKILPVSSDKFDVFLLTINVDRPSCLALHKNYSDQYVPVSLQPHFPQVISELYDERLVGLAYDELLSHCQSISDRLTVTENEVTAVESTTRNQTFSPVWYRFRAGRITASKMKAVNRTSILKPSASLLRQICYPIEMKFSTPATRWGCEHEIIARDAYETMFTDRHPNFLIENCGLFLSGEYPYLGATPDGIVDCSCCGRGCMEIKCPFCTKDQFKNESVSCLEEVDGQLRLKRDSQYYFQVQTQLHVCNLQYCDFVVWTNNDIFVERIVPCKLFWQPVAKTALNFFRSVVLPEMTARHFLGASSATTAENITQELFCTCKTPEDGNKYVACDGKECTIK